MRNILAIAWKEIRTYFTTPTAYIVAMVFLAITGYFFVASIGGPGLPQAQVQGYLRASTFVLILFAPGLTMRLLAEEQKLGTFELLLTSPIRDWEVVLGKFLASLVFFTATLAVTLFYLLLLSVYGNPDTGPVFTSYLGFLLYGAMALAVGLLASSFTSNQIVAAVVGFGILLLLFFSDSAVGAVSGVTATVLREVSMRSHYDDFLRGIINTSDVVYYVSMIVLFLFLTVRSLETRRWR